jgi:hypothetical protein
MSHLIWKRFSTLLGYRAHSPSMATTIKWAFNYFAEREWLSWTKASWIPKSENFRWW